ncbi:MAG: phosphoribosyltransferase family protein [Myxococcota bacterium]
MDWSAVVSGLWVSCCVVCAAEEVHGVCEACAEHWQLVPIPKPLAGVQHAVALTPYDSATGDRLRRAKYGADRAAIVGLARAFSAHVGPWLRGAVDAVVPVPSAWTRRARRGFATASVLAQVLAKRLRVPLIHALHMRTGAPNASFDAMQRRANLRQRIRSIRPVVGRAVLVDDVLTTGATAEACVRELLGERTETVIVAVLCATERRDEDAGCDRP